jgi:hypothetical protein
MLATNWVCKSAHLARHTSSNEEQKREPQKSIVGLDNWYHPGRTRRNVAKHHFHTRAADAEDIVDCRGDRLDFRYYPEAEAGAESTLTPPMSGAELFSKIVRLLRRRLRSI